MLFQNKSQNEALETKMPFNEATKFPNFLSKFPNVINCLVCAVNKLLKLDKRFIGKDGHVNTILIFNNVSKIFRILLLFFAIVIDESFMKPLYFKLYDDDSFKMFLAESLCC